MFTGGFFVNTVDYIDYQQGMQPFWVTEESHAQHTQKLEEPANCGFQLRTLYKRRHT